MYQFCKRRNSYILRNTQNASVVRPPPFKCLYDVDINNANSVVVSMADYLKGHWILHPTHNETIRRELRADSGIKEIMSALKVKYGFGAAVEGTPLFRIQPSRSRSFRPKKTKHNTFECSPVDGK